MEPDVPPDKTSGRHVEHPGSCESGSHVLLRCKPVLPAVLEFAVAVGEVAVHHGGWWLVLGAEIAPAEWLRSVMHRIRRAIGVRERFRAHDLSH